jgi:hypothetical protein
MDERATSVLFVKTLTNRALYQVNAQPMGDTRRLDCSDGLRGTRRPVAGSKRRRVTASVRVAASLPAGGGLAAITTQDPSKLAVGK